MKKLILLLSALTFVSAGLLTAGCATEESRGVSRHSAKPTMGERFSEEAVKGRVVKAEGDYIWIREENGKEVRVHVDDRTKMDKVVPGDYAKAYITDSGHATTIQRIRE
jgi:hypothetical protein